MTVETDKLLKMAEQITANMNYSDDEALVAAKIADHLQRFWDPRMKTALIELFQQEPDSLSPLLQAAIVKMG